MKNIKSKSLGGVPDTNVLKDQLDAVLREVSCSCTFIDTNSLGVAASEGTMTIFALLSLIYIQYNTLLHPPIAPKRTVSFLQIATFSNCVEEGKHNIGKRRAAGDDLGFSRCFDYDQR